MNYSDRKYRQNIDKLINKSLNYVLNEVNNTQQNQNQQGQQQTPNYFGNEYRVAKGQWSMGKNLVNKPLGNDSTGYNTNAEDDYGIVGCGSIHSNWMVITTRNGYQAWKNVNGKFHPVHTNPDFINQTGCEGEFVWFDKCSDFIGNGNPYAKGYGGLFRRKEKKHYAIGKVDNIAYKVYADGTFDLEPYQQFHNYTNVDKNNNTIEGNYFEDGVVNSDGTYTTNFLIQNSKDYDPNKFIRIKFDDRKLMQKFYYIWGNTMNNSNHGQNLKAGTNDNPQGGGKYYFIDMPNGPGIYDYIINLYDNLSNGNIKFTEIDRNTYRDTRSLNTNKREKPYDISGPNEPAQFSHINEDIEEKKKKNKKSRQGKNNYIQTSKNPSISTTSSKQEQSQEVNQNNYSDDYSNNQYQDEQQSNERPDIIVFGNRIEGEDNTVYRQTNNTDIQPGQYDQFYGLYTNPYTQKQFYYRFTYTQENDEQGTVTNYYNVYIGNDPYEANTHIGNYEIKNQNDISELYINTTRNNYKTIFPQDIENSKQSYPVTSLDGKTNYGTMHLWWPTNDPFSQYQGGLLEKQIKKITKQILKEYIYGKTM